MQCRADGWFELDVDCDAGECYRYRLADGLAVPDPASRAQTDDVHGYSRVVDPHAYPWQTPDWRGRPWHETVLYELHVGACGGFLGVIERLPALVKLGITAVELMPLNDRSEEHTSELQSLMRISYAVFCLKKKKTTTINNQ